MVARLDLMATYSVYGNGSERKEQLEHEDVVNRGVIIKHRP